MKETDHHIKMALIWGVIIILVSVLFGFLGRIKRHGKQGDPWQVEAQVVKKSTTMRDNGEMEAKKFISLRFTHLIKKERNCLPRPLR